MIISKISRNYFQMRLDELIRRLIACHPNENEQYIKHITNFLQENTSFPPTSKPKDNTFLGAEINRVIARNRMYNYHPFTFKPPKNPTTEMNGAALNMAASFIASRTLTETKQQKLLRLSKMIKEIAKELQTEAIE